MWFSQRIPTLLLSAALAGLVPGAAADTSQRVLRSNSLNSCQANSQYQASLFNVVFTPNDDTALIKLIAMSSVEGNVVFDIAISAYGYEFLRKTLDPCDPPGLPGLCPMISGNMDSTFVLHPGPNAINQIPGIAYTFPDLDAKVRVLVNRTDGDRATVACVEANISNGQTVDLIGVKWAAAVVAALTLTSSAVLSGLGHLNAASHVAVNALSLFTYFQSQAMIGLLAIPLPPVARAWTQDFQWSLGIINVDFMQTIFTWYQRATGGTPSGLFGTLGKVSVEVQKRSLDAIKEPVTHLNRRANVAKSSGGSYLVTGIQRAGFQAGIELSNIFLTSVAFFIVLMAITAIAVVLFRYMCEFAARRKWIQHDTFHDFRNGWQTVLKGIMFRMTLIGYPAIAIMCLWELTQKDSAAEMVLAIFFFLSATIALGWGAYKVIRIASRSVALHRNPAYILFSDPRVLNKWGFLYIQFRATGYYFIVPVLAYTLLKGKCCLPAKDPVSLSSG